MDLKHFFCAKVINQSFISTSSTVIFLKNIHHACCIKHDSCSVEIGQNGDNSTTLPIIISVGDTNPAVIIFSGRSFSSANTCMISNNMYESVIGPNHSNVNYHSEVQYKILASNKFTAISKNNIYKSLDCSARSTLHISHIQYFNH